MKTKSYSFLLLVILLTVAAVYRYMDDKNYPYQFGLDINGGVRLTYQMDTSDLTPEQKKDMPRLTRDMHQILENRVAQSLGVVEGNVQSKGNNQFVVELPSYKDPEQARKILSSTAKIKFYHARNIATQRIPNRRYSISRDETNNDKDTVVLFSSTINPEKVYKPSDPEYKRMIDGWELILEGTDLKRASYSSDPSNANSFIPQMEFTNEGSKKMERWSRRVNNRGEMLAAVLDNKVISIAGLRDGPEGILSSKVSITSSNGFKSSYVKNLVNLLNGGSLPVDLKEISSETVDPMIGRHALDKIVQAGVISFGVICLFLLAYYMFPGIIAIIALCLYVLFSLAVLKTLGATFSLASIAAFILSVGMAVDANILVFERVKEEMREGKTLLKAIQLGFMRALPAIVDSNACTILTSLVLAFIGTGPVKGFAYTLIIGLIISFFTAITVTRSLLLFFVGSGIGNNEKWFALGRQWFGENLEQSANTKPLQIVNNSKKFFMISLISMIPGVIYIFLGGLKPNVEFQGGVEIVYQMAQDSNRSAIEVNESLEKAGIKGTNVKILSSDEGFKSAYITVPSSAGMKTSSAKERTETKYKIAKASGFNHKNEKSFTEIGPAVQQETVQNAIIGVVFGCLLIMIYLAFRFGFGAGGFVSGLRFGLSAIGALLHDVIFAIGVAAIAGYYLGWEVSALFITAMLTVIGFSVHDSIVIFDRIRENLSRPVINEDFGNLCNKSITQSFARSINTSLTVIITLAVLMFAGTTTPDLKFFVLTMLLGIISGTYSSIYNATPILYVWDSYIVKKKGEKYGLLQQAVAEQKMLEAERLSQTIHSSNDGPEESYSQVRRRNSAIEKSKRIID